MAIPAKKFKKGQTSIIKFSENSLALSEIDTLAIEEPLEIRLGSRAISITMRTPGYDFELAAGFLFTEGIIKSPDQIKDIKFCGKPGQPQNTVRVEIYDQDAIDIKRLERNFYTTSSCGVCGKSSLEALATGAKPIEIRDFPNIKAETINSLSESLRKSQSVFEQTGGLHAAGLFDADGNLLDLKEDVGRHNAVDKLIGRQFLDDNVPLSDKILFLSGRASFELIQKAVMAGIPIICAVGAPSSLAVEAAKEFGVTLLGFVRNGRFNIYMGPERIIFDEK